MINIPDVVYYIEDLSNERICLLLRMTDERALTDKQWLQSELTKIRRTHRIGVDLSARRSLAYRDYQDLVRFLPEGVKIDITKPGGSMEQRLYRRLLEDLDDRWYKRGPYKEYDRELDRFDSSEDCGMDMIP